LGETRGRIGKSGVLEQKTEISLKRVKMEEKLLWRAYRNSSTFFRTVPSLTPYGFLFAKTGALQPHPKTSIATISGTGKATDFKFGQYIHRVHPNKSSLKLFGRKRSVGVYPGTAPFG